MLRFFCRKIATNGVTFVAMTDHYFSSRLQSDFEVRHFSFTYRDRHFDWIGSRGVFSSKELDTGTQFLIDCCIEDENSGTECPNFLDLGCGTGVVGLLLATFISDISVLCSDLSAAATVCTAQNVQRLALNTRVSIVQGNGTDHLQDESFAKVALNPPIRAGNKVIFKLIEGASRVLLPGGILYMVVRVKQGGKRLARLSQQWFGQVEQMGRHKGFLVYKLVK